MAELFKRVNMRKYLAIFILFITITLRASTGNDYKILKTGIHFDSKVSGGENSIPQLANIISRTDLDVAILTDHDNMKVTYGLKPFENLINYDIQKSSISTYGYDKYFQQIHNLNLIHDDVILIPGIEAVPYYYWSGSPFQGKMTLHNWHRHMLVFGMDKIEDFKNIPSLANGKMPPALPEGNILNYIMEHLFHFLLIFIYLAGFVISILTIFNKNINFKENQEEVTISYKSLIFTLIFGTILFFEFPFLPKKYNQYEGDQGAGPYQEVINYVNKKDGLVYWAHPEAEYTDKREISLPFMDPQIKLSTTPYPELISKTYEHDGFAIFWEGMKSVGKPGGIWDMTLNQYCRGIRKSPFWGIGELDFEDSNNLEMINETNTFLFTKEKSSEAVLDAIKKGRMYSTRGYFGDKVELKDFTLQDVRTGKTAFLGETLNPQGDIIKAHIQIDVKQDIKPQNIYLYKKDKLKKIIPLQNDLKEDFNLPVTPKSEITYYKIYVGSRDFKILVTNPIFIKKI